MPDEKALIPVPVPPLAVALAAMEKKKGAPLTQAEAEAIRDKCPCIMLYVEDAKKLTERRGYVDVNPENCWADWHRLRPQMVSGYLPKIVLCIPGGNDLRQRCEPILKAAKAQYEIRPHDPKIVAAFKAGSMTWPSLNADDYSRLATHTTVLYALSKNFPAAAAAETGKACVRLGRQLLDAGGLAIKCESSGLAHSAERWARFSGLVERNPLDQWAALFDAFVFLPIRSNGDLYTCGMHLLGVPDLIVATSVVAPASNADNCIAAAVRLFRSLGIYLVSECPVGILLPGTPSAWTPIPRDTEASGSRARDTPKTTSSSTHLAAGV